MIPIHRHNGTAMTVIALLAAVLLGLASAPGVADDKKSGSGSGDATPKHLEAARELVKNLKLEDSSYNHGDPVVSWKGDDGATKYELHTDCSGFIDALLMHSYGYDRKALKKWLGKNRPTADSYHDKIVDETGFAHIEKLADAKPGDLLALKFKVRTDNTGHMMLIAGPPKKVDATKPIIKDTDQWEVPVIDTSETGHGPDDTRHGKGKEGKDHDGVGEGVLRVYTHADGTIAGFTWSALSSSEFRSQKDWPLVLGRLKQGYKP